MQKRGWRVLLLKEILPNNNSLLGFNMNRGEVIAIRCKVIKPFLFFELQSVLGGSFIIFSTYTHKLDEFFLLHEHSRYNAS